MTATGHHGASILVWAGPKFVSWSSQWDPATLAVLSHKCRRGLATRKHRASAHQSCEWVVLSYCAMHECYRPLLLLQHISHGRTPADRDARLACDEPTAEAALHLRQAVVQPLCTLLQATPGWEQEGKLAGEPQHEPEHTVSRAETCCSSISSRMALWSVWAASKRFSAVETVLWSAHMRDGGLIGWSAQEASCSCVSGRRMRSRGVSSSMTCRTQHDRVGTGGVPKGRARALSDVAVAEVRNVAEGEGRQRMGMCAWGVQCWLAMVGLSA